MLKLRSLLAGAFAASLLAVASPLGSSAIAQETELPNKNWSFENPFGTFDLAAAQRGFQIYGQVCSNCHSLQYLHYRDLTGIGLTEDQIKAFAAGVTVPSGTDDQGAPKDGPATPASQFRSPFANVKAAAAANNGGIPPDLSLIVNAREGGPNYIYGILTGYTDAPAGFKVGEGLYYNKVFPGHQIHMPQPLRDGTVDYTDGTPNSLDQQAHDVVTFLAWAANPEEVGRKQMGVRIVLFLVFMTGLTYAVKRRVWSDVEH
jgi:ubiquinol-cytochrome c reductase cytochrome c1 subunit